MYIAMPYLSWIFGGVGNTTRNDDVQNRRQCDEKEYRGRIGMELKNSEKLSSLRVSGFKSFEILLLAHEWMFGKLIPQAQTTFDRK